MELSVRLQAITDLVRYLTVADIGTDHGYVPIALHKKNRITKALACDINKGPLEKAEKNIKAENAQNIIETRLGNGLVPINPKEVESIVIAGMGGILMVDILQQSPQVVDSARELILSPHSDIDLVRRKLHDMGFLIEEERIVKEEEKYYPILRAIHGQQKYQREIEYLYGKILLDRKDSVLLEMLIEQERKMEQVYARLSKVNTKNSNLRMIEIQTELGLIKEAIQCLSLAETL